MPVQRDLWKESFQSWPNLPCPRCRVGTLKIVDDSIAKTETSSSKAARTRAEWDPDWIHKRFIATMACSGPTCGDIVSVCGEIVCNWFYDYDSEGHSHALVTEYYVPRFFEPASPVFEIPDKCPKIVRDELKKAFALIWSDVGSSENRLRVAVEALMNEHNIQKKAKITPGEKKGKLRGLSLHQRIERFGSTAEIASTQLMAIKWLGNVGSHAAMHQLTRADLLDAFKHFEFALDLAYSKKGLLEKRAKHIIKNKGPIRAKVRKRRRRPVTTASASGR